MYVQASFAETDPEKLLALAARYPFATVITPGADELWVSHLPLLVRRRGGAVVLAGHLARANAHWQAMEQGAPTTAIFHGPHAYISPTWYATSPAVPTWNYVVVHARGRVRRVDASLEHLRELVATFEAGAAEPWSVDRVDAHARKILPGMVAFEIAVEQLDGKLKLNQNRKPEDWAGVVEAFSASDDPALGEMVALMRRLGPPA